MGFFLDWAFCKRALGRRIYINDFGKRLKTVFEGQIELNPTFDSLGLGGFSVQFLRAIALIPTRRYHIDEGSYAIGKKISKEREAFLVLTALFELIKGRRKGRKE